MRKKSLVSLALATTAATFLAGCDGCVGDPLYGLVPLITPSVDALDFGALSVGADRERSVALRSSGTGPLAIASFVIEGDDSFALASAGDPVELKPGETAEAEVRFAPALAGPAQGTLVVKSDADNDAELRIPLTATAGGVEDCDDDNACTEDSFDPASGQCTRRALDSACDDGNSCTSDDRCNDGQCRGVAVTCPSGDVCSVGFCDPFEGCRTLPDPEACEDDGDPCTLEICDAEEGCTQANAANGTPCAPTEGCAAMWNCREGACVDSAVPDGTPCDDGDSSTLIDRCTLNVCVGICGDDGAALLGTVRSFGGSTDGMAEILPDGRILFIDEAGSAAPLLTLVSTEGDVLSVISRLSLPAPVMQGAVRALDESRVLIGLRFDSGFFITGTSALLVRIAGDGTMTVAGESPPLMYNPFSDVNYALIFALAGAGDAAWALECQQGAIMPLDLSDEAAPVWGTPVPLRGGASRCTGALSYDAGRSKLYAAWNDALFVLDVSDPHAPALGSTELEGRDPLDVQLSPNGLWIAMGTEPTFGAEFPSTLVRFDPQTFAETGSIPAATFYFASFAVLESSILIGEHNVVNLWSDPAEAAPAHIASALTGWSADPRRGLGNVVVTSSNAGTARVMRVSASATAPFSFLTGPEHGGLWSLQRVGASLYALDANASHVVDTADPTAPYIATGSGGTVPRADFIGLGAGARAPIVLARHGLFDPKVVLNWGFGQPGAWLDFSDPASLAVVGTAVRPADDRDRAIRIDGRFLYAAVQPIFDEGEPDLAFEIYDLESIEPAFGVTLSPVASLSVPYLGNASLADGSLAQILAVAETGDQAVAVWASLNGPGAELTVFDLTSPPALAAQTGFSDLTTRSVGIGQHRVVAVSDSTALGYIFADTLAAFSVDDGELVPTGELSLFGDRAASHVLAFDGKIVVLASQGGVGFVDASLDPPVYLGRVATTATPMSAAFILDGVVVAGETFIDVVAPPCAVE